jgi:hypothetical protein
MKRFAWLLWLALGVADCALAAQCGDLPLAQHHKSDGTMYGVFMSPETVEKAPKWTPAQDDPPPLSPSRAAAIALDSAKQVYENLRDLEVRTISLVPYYCPEKPGYWLYSVSFSAKRSDGFPSGASVAVLMNGTVGVLSEFEMRGMEIVRKGTAARVTKPDPAAKALATEAVLAEPTERVRYDGPPAYHNLGMETDRLLLEGEFDVLERRFTQMIANDERLPDGRETVTVALVGANRYWLSGAGDWEKLRKRVDEWKTRSPRSANAALFEALYWHSYAWNARGEGYSSTTTDRGRELFRERLARARRVLEESREYAGNSGAWHTVMLWVATAEGWPLERQLALFREAASRWPLFYGPYEAMLMRLLPRWGGGHKEVAEFIAASARSTQPLAGRSMYAVLYRSYARYESDRQPFEQVGISWPLMKGGFEDLVKRHPSVWNVGTFAWYACQAGDRTVFLELLPQLQRRGTGPETFTGSYSLQNCIDMFHAQT